MIDSGGSRWAPWPGEPGRSSDLDAVAAPLRGCGTEVGILGEVPDRVADGSQHQAYLASEYIQYQSCSDADFLFDPTCGGTRSEFTNWGTGLVKVNV